MAATRKRAKRAGRRKRSSAKGSSTKKRPRRKSAKGRTKRRASKRATLKRTAKRTARKGLRAAKGGIATVRHAGEKTWEVLRSTTAQVMEGVKDRLGSDADRNPTY